LVVTGSALLRAALEPVYEALELDWDPRTAGSVEDELPGIGVEQAERAILAELARELELVEATIDDRTLELAARIEQGRLA
jgi:hypothetical protein